jgi:hypothetical protein
MKLHPVVRGLLNTLFSLVLPYGGESKRSEIFYSLIGQALVILIMFLAYGIIMVGAATIAYLIKWVQAGGTL